MTTRREDREMDFVQGSNAPRIGDLVRCARCTNTYSVVHDDSAGVSTIALARVVVLPGERAADAEASWCPCCASDFERAKGATFSPPRAHGSDD